MPVVDGEPRNGLACGDGRGAGALQAAPAIDTTNPPGNERAAADFLARVLDQEGIPFACGERADAREPGGAPRGSGKKAPLLLNGHLDVVPVERDRWSHDPFGAEEHDGCIWGRGAIDMKNMVTMSLMTLVLLKRAGVPLDRDVIFAAVADEEAGSRLGSQFLVEQHPELVRAEYVLNEIGAYTFYVGDAVFYPVQVAEKGICWFELTAQGTPGHGSMPRPDNAVVRIARAIEALGTVRLPFTACPWSSRSCGASSKGARARPDGRAAPSRPAFARVLLKLAQLQDPEQAISLEALLRNTASPTVLSGGSKVNVIPSSASVLVDGRMLPGQTVDAFLAEVQRVVGDDLRVRVLEQHEGTDLPHRYAPLRPDRPDDREAPPGVGRRPVHDPRLHRLARVRPAGRRLLRVLPREDARGLNYTSLYHGHDERIPIDGFAWGLRVLVDLVHEFCVGPGAPASG